MMNSITTTTARIAARGNNSNSSRNSCWIAVKALFSTTTSRTSTSSSSPLATRQQQQQQFCHHHHPPHPFISRRNYCSLSSSFSASYSGAATTTASSVSPLIRMMISVRSFSATTSGGSSSGGGDGGDGSSSDKKETGSKAVIDSDSDTDSEQAKDKEEPTTTPSAATVPIPPTVPEGAHLVAEEVDNTMNSPTSTGTTSISTYDPYEIVKSFEDTSYYYPPSEEMDPDYLAAKYQTFTNQDLLDSSTIVPIMDSDRPNNNNKSNTWQTLIHSPPTRDLNLPKGTLVGTVVSTKMEKTVNVAIDRYRIHPKYSKRMKYTRKFMAHDEQEVASLGDTVMIVPCQRISKMKHFMLREIVTAKGQL